MSLDSVLGDVRALQRGLELTQREFVRQDDCVVLKEFLRANSPTMDKLLADSKTAQVGWGCLALEVGREGWAAKGYLGGVESPKPGGAWPQQGHLWGWSRNWGPPARRSKDEVTGILVESPEVVRLQRGLC